MMPFAWPAGLIAIAGLITVVGLVIALVVLW